MGDTAKQVGIDGDTAIQVEIDVGYGYTGGDRLGIRLYRWR